MVKTINCVCRKRARNCRARTPRLRGEKKEENEKRERITQKRGPSLGFRQRAAAAALVAASMGGPFG